MKPGRGAAVLCGAGGRWWGTAVRRALGSDCSFNRKMIITTSAFVITIDSRNLNEEG